MTFLHPAQGNQSDQGRSNSPNGNTITITSIYIPGCNPNINLITDIEAIFALGRTSIICEDYNAHHISWGGKFNKPGGNIINNFITNTNTDLLALPTPTRPPPSEQPLSDCQKRASMITLIDGYVKIAQFQKPNADSTLVEMTQKEMRIMKGEKGRMVSEFANIPRV
ncbi:hypothetical protein TNCT_124531 [Trichonephila clavata]|uniref:Endonuclease/exonuclease/phosphatase domain-containing protein n=1 Tax=Trichonephila clavata TaxID=2740835 RepID=A0A8X6FUQ1_TRICU|nr:hypothetical protein TNCT_124531 [Trichonephila clavata]